MDDLTRILEDQTTILKDLTKIMGEQNLILEDLSTVSQDFIQADEDEDQTTSIGESFVRKGTLV